MRILFSTYSMAFQNPGGGEEVFKALKDELLKLGQEITLFDPWKDECVPLKNFNIIHHFSCIDTSYWRYFKRTVPEIPLFVTPTIRFPEGRSAKVMTFKRKAQNTLLHGSARSFYRWSHVELPDFWLPTTAAEANGLRDIWGISQNKIRVLTNGVHARFFEANPEEFRKQTRIEGPYVLHVGRFHPVKNQLGLIEAMAGLGMHMVFIGGADLEQKAYLESCKVAAKQVESRDSTGNTIFTFLPPMKNTDPRLPSACAGANVFVLPSHFETFGIAALEAAAAGAPLVMTENTNARELFSKFATFINPYSAHDIRDAIQKKSLENPTDQERSSRRELLERYRWSQIASELLTCYLSFGGEAPSRDLGGLAGLPTTIT